MFGQTPEVLENEIGECLAARAASLGDFHGLGPPDLVQLTKTTKSKASSTYHFVTGVDVSSPAAIAAYLMTLTTTLGETQLWLGKAPQWRVSEGTYCAWNIFSKVDIRVSATFPGETKFYLLRDDGLPQDGNPDDEEQWRELYMSAMIRCLLLKDDSQLYSDNTRHEFPFDPSGVQKFLESFAALFPLGYLVGANTNVQRASLACNFMVDSLYRLLDATGCYDAAIEMLGKIDHSEAKIVLAQVLLSANHEVNAASLLVRSVRKDPRNSLMLAAEADFCLSKARPDLALDCAKRAVAATPRDFFAWEVLVRSYIALKRWDDALLALNSTPLPAVRPPDVQRMPPPKKVHRPLPQDGVLDEAWQFTANEDDPVSAKARSVEPALRRIPAANLRGAAAKAYGLLATINRNLGWNGLMQLRSELFWLDEQPIDTPPKTSKEGSVKPGNSDETSNSKTDGERTSLPASSTADNVDKEQLSGAEVGDAAAHGGGSDDEHNDQIDQNGLSRDATTKDTSNDQSAEAASAEVDSAGGTASNLGDNTAESGAVEGTFATSESTNDALGHTATPSSGDAEIAASAVAEAGSSNRRSETPLRFKRLCEKRIDNLYQALYRDTQVYWRWNRHRTFMESQKLPFERSSAEWCLFGLTARRLQHNEDAKQAFDKSVSMYFNHHALQAELDLEPLNLEVVVKLMAWNHRWYNEFSPQLMASLRKIVARDGLTRVKYEVEAEFGKQSVVDLLKIELERLKALKVRGWDM